MALDPLPYPIKTDDIGAILEQEYRDKDPNTHITYFCVRLGDEIQKEMEEKMASIFKKTLNEVICSIEPEQDKVKIWRPYEQGWHAQAILFIKFDLECKNEREREDKLNKEIRMPLIENFKKATKSQLPPETPIHVMFSRACLYTDYEEDKRCKISTDRIGNILKNEYGVGDTMIDYFYLFVQAERDKKAIQIHMQEFAVTTLNELSEGEWRIVESEETWRGVFYGFFPKSSNFMTEREREKELYSKVAKPLREKLREKIIKEIPDEPEPQVHIIITRACEYNPTTQKLPFSYRLCRVI